MDALTANDEGYLFASVNEFLSYAVKLQARNLISAIDSEQISDRREQISDLLTPAIKEQIAKSGIDLQSVHMLDLTFPKVIQNLFAKQLEAKIRAKTDLENARTAVATARA